MMQEFFFEERGISYRKNEFRADRPTLVLIHGLSGSCSAWFPYELLFAQKYNLLTFDLRGHGKSDKPRRYTSYDLKECADDLHKLLEELNIETCALVSHSFGTLVALELLNAHPERVSKTVFLSPTAFLTQTPWFWLVRTIGGGLTALLRILPFIFFPRGRVDYTPYHHTSDWNVFRIYHDLSVTTVRIYMYCLMHAYAPKYDGMWERVRVPTLIMHGTDDSIIPVRHAVELAKKISHAELALLAHANHVIVLNNVSNVAHRIETFI